MSGVVQFPRERQFHYPRGFLGRLFEAQESGAMTARLWGLPEEDDYPSPVLDDFMRVHHMQVTELCEMHGAGESALIHMRALFRLHVMAGTIRLRSDAA